MCEMCHCCPAVVYVVDACEGGTMDWCFNCLWQNRASVGEWHRIVPKEQK